MKDRQEQNLLPVFLCVIVWFPVAEEQSDTPDACKADQRENDAGEKGCLAAK